MTAGMLLLIIAIGAMGFLIAVPSRWKKSIQNDQTSPLPPTRHQSWAIVPAARTLVACWLAPTGVMIVFVALSGAANRISIGDGFAPRHTLVTVIDADIRQNESSQAQDQSLALNRPKWVSEGDIDQGDIKKVVLSSRLWTTEAEARQELQAKVAQIVRNDFEQRHHDLLDPTGYRYLTTDRMVEVAVKERYVERIEQDFGKFSAPMNRLWWQVEISPMVRTELYPAWKAAAIQNRVIVIGVILSLLTLLANAIGLFAKLKNAPACGLAQAFALTSVSVFPWIAAELLITSRLLS